MLTNYIKYALRYFWKNKAFSLINVTGLTVGLACFLLIINFVQHELSYDDYVEDAENVYRVNLVRKNTGAKAAAIGPPMGPAMKVQMPEIDTYVRIRHADNVLIRIGEEEFYENGVFYVDSTFLDIFTFPLLKGDEATVFNRKNKVLLSHALANKYFPGQDPIGEVISLDDDLELQVTGVVGVPSTPSHFEFDMLISFETFEVPFGYPVTLDSWGWTSFPTYVRLHDDVNPEQVNAKFNDFIGRNMNERAAEALDMELQSISDIHLYSKDISERDGIPNKGDIKYVTILFAIALLILGLAVFNFANLSTTLSLKRVKEVGVRKTLGAYRASIFWQYSMEAFLISLVSCILAVTVLEVFSNSLAAIFGAELRLVQFLITNWHYALGLVLIVGFLGGAYPAIFLSQYLPVKALKNKVSDPSNRFSLKSILVGLQFFITIGLVVSSITIKEQMQFLREKELGFNHEQVIALQIEGETLSETYALTRQRLLLNPNVLSVTASGNLFDGQNGSVPVVDHENEEESFRISLFGGHYDFIKTMDLEMIEGRDFSEQFANDSSGFILNEAAVKMLGWKESALGKELTVNVWEGEVIGVVKDFHFASLHENITPLVIRIPDGYMDYIFVKTKEGNLTESMASLESEWKSIYPELPFDYTFLDSHIQKMYKADQDFSSLVYSFSGLAIFLACLGLYGMIGYTIDTRLKEIGVRKVLGASLLNVVGLLSRQFLTLILLASAFVVPIAWYLLRGWLSDFAYKIELSPLFFSLAIILTLLVAFLTMSIKTIRAGLSNPVDILKEE